MNQPNKKQLNVNIDSALFDVVKDHVLSGQKYIEQLIKNDRDHTDKLDNFYDSVQKVLDANHYDIDSKLFVNETLNSAFSLLDKVK